MVYKIRRRTVQKPNNNNNNNNNNNINHKNNYDNLGVAHPQSGSSSHISGRIGIQLEPLVFEERGNAGYPEKNLSEQWREPTKDSWSTHKARIWTRTTSVGCECSHHCARTLALYKQKNDGLLWGTITLINCLLINFFLLLFQNTAFLLILSLIICNDAITVQQSPCQIQSFYAREIGSGEGNLLRVHLDTAGIPTNVSISGSCDSTKIKFSSKLFIFLVVMKNFN